MKHLPILILPIYFCILLQYTALVVNTTSITPGPRLCVYGQGKWLLGRNSEGRSLREPGNGRQAIWLSVLVHRPVPHNTGVGKAHRDIQSSLIIDRWEAQGSGAEGTYPSSPLLVSGVSPDHGSCSRSAQQSEEPMTRSRHLPSKLITHIHSPVGLSS